MPFIIDKDTANIIHSMGAQSNPQFQLKFKNLDIGEFEMNGVKVTYHDDSFLVGDNICEFLDGFINFLTNPYVTYGDIVEDEKIKFFISH